MKRFTSLSVVLFSLCLVSVPLWAAVGSKTAGADRSPSAGLATTLSTVTGIAISPLMGTGAYGAYQYFMADTPEKKAALPWFAQIGFWLPALALVGACAAKDSLGAALPPGLKKPLDILETVENKLSGLVAAGAVVPLTIDTLTGLITRQALAPELGSSGLALLQVGFIDLQWLLNLLTVPLGLAIFGVVWMASHAINVLILLSPWGAIDAALKGARAGLLGLLTLTSTLDPMLGALLSLLVIVVAYLVAGWAFRLTVFGTVFCWDFFSLRRYRYRVKGEGDWVFTGARLKQAGVPVRSYGSLHRGPEGLEFRYRSWLVGARCSVLVPEKETAVGKGLFITSLQDAEGALLIFPPRYRGQEEVLAQLFKIPGGVQAAGLRKAWSALRELFTGGSSKPSQVNA